MTFNCFGKRVAFVEYKRDYDRIFLKKVLKDYPDRPIFLSSEYAFLKDELKTEGRDVKIICGCTPRDLINEKKPLILFSGSFYRNWFFDCDCVLVDMVSKEVIECSKKIKDLKTKFILFMNSKYVALVFSLKSGQFFENLGTIESKVSEIVKDYDLVFFTDDVYEETLINLRYDFYIFTCCPRVLEKLSLELKRISIHYLDFLRFKEFL